MINSVIDSVNYLLMAYFNDDRPVTGKLLERKCKQSVLVEALEKGYLRVLDKDCDGYNRYVITEAGKEYRNN